VTMAPYCWIARPDGESLSNDRWVRLSLLIGKIRGQNPPLEMPRTALSIGSNQLSKRRSLASSRGCPSLLRRQAEIAARKCHRSSWRGLLPDARTPGDSRFITPETTPHSIPTNPATAPGDISGGDFWTACKRRSKNPSVKHPSWSVAPE